MRSVDEGSKHGQCEISAPALLPSEPVASILMLAYNHGPYLAEAIEGVLNQATDFPIELLIGEDCSTDDTRAVAMRYQAHRPDVVRVITSSKNVGMLENMRRLINAGRGDFQAFCEGDDYWTDPNKLQRQVNYLRANPDAGAVHTDFDHILRRGGRWLRLSNYQQFRFGRRDVPAGNIFLTLLRGNFIQTCTLCVRADLNRAFLKGGFLKDSYPFGDWPLCLFISATHKVGYLLESTAVYRKVPGSMMNSGHVFRARSLSRCTRMIDDFCDFFHVSAADRIAALVPLYRGLLSMSMFAGDNLWYECSLAWLENNDAAYSESWRGRLLPWLAKSRTIRNVLTWVQCARVYIRELRMYR